MLFDYGMKEGLLRGGITWQDVLDRFPDNDYFCNNQVFVLMVERGIYKPEEYMWGFFKPNFSYKLSMEPELAAGIKEIYSWGIPDLEEVVAAVRHAGGVPVVAHPSGLEKHADELLKMGVMGFETHHPSISEECKAFFDAYCTEHRLYKLGGTDHSGPMGCPDTASPEADCGGTSEAEFMKLYRRELG